MDSDVFVTLGKINFMRVSIENLGQKVVFCLDDDGIKTFTDGVIHKAAQRLVDLGKEIFIAFPEQINEKSNTKNSKIDFNSIARLRGISAVRDSLNSII